jgi:periplasmic divalent cation tolerance protein
MPGLVQVLTTFETREQAVEMARAAVDARVAACVQVVGPITSTYRWEGKVEEAQEFLCLMKAPLEGLERLAEFVRERHPYNTPEITAVESLFVDDRYLAWAVSETLVAQPFPTQ